MAQFLFFMFFVLKPFYIFPSGRLGLADICLLCCFAALMGELIPKGRKYSAFFRQQMDWLLFLFISCVIVINGIYTSLLGSGDFIRASLFWIYNGLAVWCFVRLGEGKNFEKWLCTGIKINLTLQILILLSGRGRLFYEPWGGTRYMGTFNDPNQMAFFIFCMVLLLYLYGKRGKGVFYILSSILIWKTKSTGAFLGVLVFAVALSIRKLSRIVTPCKSRRIFIVLITIGALCIAGVLFLAVTPGEAAVGRDSFTVFQRIQEKMGKMKGEGLEGLIFDRGWEKMLLYPGFLLFGAGEGGYERFLLAQQVNEIHSSLFSVLFCYGAAPTILLLVWIDKQLKSLNGWMWPAVLALLTESFFLVNYRQPIFWMILLTGRIYMVNAKNKYKHAVTDQIIRKAGIEE